MINNKDFCEEVGIKPKTIRWIEERQDPTTDKWNTHNICDDVYPDFLSKTLEASFNRELLEECILKVFGGISYSETVMIKEPFVCSVVDGTEDIEAFGNTLTEVLIALAIYISDNLKEEISKVTEFIY